VLTGAAGGTPDDQLGNCPVTACSLQQMARAWSRQAPAPAAVLMRRPPIGLTAAGLFAGGRGIKG
jgi:hypothetical protein